MVRGSEVSYNRTAEPVHDALSKEGASSEEAFNPIPVNSLRLDTVAEFDIYLKPGGPGRFVLYREKNLEFTEEDKARLEASGIDEVYIPESQDAAYRRYVERNLGAILSDERVEPATKSGILYTSLVGVVSDVLHDPRSGEVVPRSESVVKHTCQFLYEQEGAFSNLMRVTAYDYYTYTHSVDVFVYSLALAQRALPRDQVLQDFGLGALLHDIGKSLIDPAIINCKGKLTDAQFVEMKKHPAYGHEILLEQGGVGPVSLDMVRHHHEKFNGSGYPDGLRKDGIAPQTRILAIADIFDALTTRRPYKAALGSFSALKLMKDEMGDELDTDLFCVFVNMMGHPSD
ncbi:MAG: HD domain-containing protein [Candidatus Hydrogenedentes bacterium]|nr:HD domain-containing protein [Candidatus Hydrogenedentota bacterium]